MQRYTLIFTTVCCLILAGFNLFLNYRLYSIVQSEAFASEAVFLGTAPSLTEPNAEKAISANGLPGADGTSNTSSVGSTVSASGYSRLSPQSAGSSGAATPGSATAPLYLLGMKDGYITVFYGSGNGTLVKEVTALSADALPFDEKLRLSRGIPVYNESQLAMLLQDYGS